MDAMSSDETLRMPPQVNRLTTSVRNSQATTHQDFIALKESLQELKNESHSMKEEIQATSERLADALEALNVSQATTNQHLVNLKQSFQEFQNQHLVVAKDSLDELQKGNQSMKEETESIKEEIKALCDVAHGQEADKMRCIEFAYQKVPLEEPITSGKVILQVFKTTQYVYDTPEGDSHSDPDKTHSVRSVGPETLLSRTLVAFRRGCGFCVEHYFMDTRDSFGNYPSAYRESEITDEKIQSLRDLLSSRLHDLLGKKPHFECVDGEMCVYYE